MRTHKLKILPSEFGPVVSGTKPFEFRKNDRDFAVGDELVLQEWDPSLFGNKYTSHEQKVIVGYILHGGRYGVPEGYCVMGIRRAMGE